jgi:hypothetical protein
LDVSISEVTWQTLRVVRLTSRSVLRSRAAKVSRLAFLSIQRYATLIDYMVSMQSVAGEKHDAIECSQYAPSASSIVDIAYMRNTQEHHSLGGKITIGDN